MLSDEFLQELRSKIDIEEIIAPYVNLRRRGRTYTGLCPFHNEKTPSFTVYPETQSSYCFGCGAGGDAITFVRRMDNLDYMEAVKSLADRAGLALPQDGYDDTLMKQRRRMLEANRVAARYFHETLFTPEGAAALSYLQGPGPQRENNPPFWAWLCAEPMGWAPASHAAEGLFRSGTCKRQPCAPQR